MDDEFEVEVTDLRTGRRVEQVAPLLSPLSSPPRSYHELDDSDEPDDPAEVSARAGAMLVAPRWLRTRWSDRRTLSTVVSLAALLMLVALVLASVPNSGATLRALLQAPTPTATATLAPGDDTFYATGTVPWGRLLSDGQQIQPVQDPNGARELYFTLSRGTHTLRYDAPPFPTVTCRVSVPASPHDTCPLANAHLLIGGSGPETLAQRTLDMGASLERLPQDELLTLTKLAGGAVYNQVGTAEGLQGDHYLADDSTIMSAAQPFQAALVYTLNVDANRVAPDIPPQCVTLCDVGGVSPGQEYWPIEAHIVVSWRYTFADGSVATGPGIGQAVAPSDTLIELDVAWNGQWQIGMIPQAGALCGLAFSALSTAGGSTAGTGGQLTPSSAMGGANPSDGCFIGLSTVDATGATQAPQAYLLYRFGLMLTVNAQAQQMFPALPQANAHEQALAQQIGQRLVSP